MPKKILAGFLFAVIIFLLSSQTTVATSTTYYFSPAFEKVKETGEITKYYPLPGGATVVKKGNELSYLHTDQLSSTRLITNGQGLKTNDYNYYPYGRTFNATSLNLPSSRLYTSQIMDNSTDLYFYNARYYNPTTGAFISADSAQGPNRYAYVGGNPISLNDPSGNGPTTEGIKKFINYDNPEVPNEWRWLAYTQLVNPFFYFDKFIEKPVAEKYNISVAKTVTIAGTGAGLVYGGLNLLANKLIGDLSYTGMYNPEDAVQVNQMLARETGVGKVIWSTYRASAELESIREAFISGDPAVMQDTFWKVSREMERKNRLYLVLTDQRMGEGHVAEISNSPGNLATLDLERMEVNMERTVLNDPEQALTELGHEYGTFLLAQHYGSKANIPMTPIGWANHVLDRLTYGDTNLTEIKSFW